MSTVEQAVPPLERGDFLSRDEFLRRWEAMKELKRAELIRGVVYMPMPVGETHGIIETNVATWLGMYKVHTPGCTAGSNTTWLMLAGEAPQPDTALWVLPEHGGRARKRRGLLEGAPEFLAEVCVSRTAYDLHQKLEVYREAGVQEYLAVLMQEREVRWHRLARRRFKVVPAPADGVYRSATFPGLWLDAAALLADDLGRVWAVLQQGLSSPEHDAFVKRLAARRSRRR
jgi:Uma2 family endonuclease